MHGRDSDKTISNLGLQPFLQANSFIHIGPFSKNFSSSCSKLHLQHHDSPYPPPLPIFSPILFDYCLFLSTSMYIPARKIFLPGGLAAVSTELRTGSWHLVPNKQ